MTVDFAEVTLRLLAAVLLGGAVGMEREAAGHQAGLRTHISISLGACLFGILSTMGFEKSVDATHVVEVTRIASQVVVGVGFLGAGVIFRDGGTVKNLTTAASMWVISAIGLGAGIGDWQISLLATAALLLSLVVLRVPRAYVRTRSSFLRNVYVGVTSPEAVSAVSDALSGTEGVEVRRVKFQKARGQAQLNVQVRADRKRFDLLLQTLVQRDDVESLSSS